MGVLDPEDIHEGMGRHTNGDWGMVCPEDAALNHEALRTGDRLVSAYKISRVKFWIVTEADRSVTTVLIPEDY